MTTVKLENKFRNHYPVVFSLTFQANGGGKCSASGLPREIHSVFPILKHNLECKTVGLDFVEIQRALLNRLVRKTLEGSEKNRKNEKSSEVSVASCRL